jgi:HAD superfamily hydrolase (TIGR01509 family)
MAPRGLLFDYGNTLVEEVSVDTRAGNEWLLSRASYRPAHVTLEDVLARAQRVTNEVAARRDQVQLETPWPTLTRLIHDVFGIRFDGSMAELELGYWKASVRTKSMPGAREALDACHRLGIPMAVVSNTSFSEPVIRYELERYGLTEHLEFVLVSSDYTVRKPNVLLLDVAAARLGVPPADIWLVGDRLDTDVAGARAAGMTAVWFNPVGRQHPSPGPDLTVADWNEFIRFVVRAPSPQGLESAP